LFYSLYFVAFAAYFGKTLRSVSVNDFSRGEVPLQYEIMKEIVELRVYRKFVKRLCNHLSLVSNRLLL